MRKEYDDFDLEIRRRDEQYQVRVLNSSSGESESEFNLPFTDVELRNFYSRIGQGNRNARRSISPGLTAAKTFGGKLFSSVFTGQIFTQLRLSEQSARSRNRGLRLRLRLKDVPELAELPWEFLYDSDHDHFIATSTSTPIVRYLDLQLDAPPLVVAKPLRVLVIISSPSTLPRLDSEGEWENLQTALASLESTGEIVLERLPVATLDALRRRARREDFHVLHFIGHGAFDVTEGEGIIHFEESNGMPNPVSGSILGNVLRDHSSLRLIILNACEGARQSAEDPFSGVAQSLCRQRIPAVVAMQFEISDDAAKTFSEEFYTAIVDGLPVDAALGETRKALFAGSFGQEWATPVLYQRSTDARLFRIEERRVDALVTEPLKEVLENRALSDDTIDSWPPAEVIPQEAPPLDQTNVEVSLEINKDIGLHDKLAIQAESSQSSVVQQAISQINIPILEGGLFCPWPRKAGYEETKYARQKAVISVLSSVKGKGQLFVTPTIPQEKLATAREKCGVSENENILGLIPTDLFRTGKSAILFGTDAIYSHYLLSDPFAVEYRHLHIRRRDSGHVLLHGQMLYVGNSGFSHDALYEIVVYIAQTLRSVDLIGPEPPLTKLWILNKKGLAMHPEVRM